MSNDNKEKNARNLVGAEVENRKPEAALTTEIKERVPLYKQNALDFFHREPGYRYRYVNDSYGRIDRFLRAGWAIVEGNAGDTYSGKGRSDIEGQKGSQIWRVVNFDKEAVTKNAVLMRIQEEFYNEDQKAKADRVLEKEKENLDPTGKLMSARNFGGSGSKFVKS